MDRLHAVLQGNHIESTDMTRRSKKDMSINNQNDGVNTPFVHKSSTSFHDVASAPLAQPPNIFPKSNEENRVDSLFVSVKQNRGGNSPLPPALSPASVSNSHSSAFASSRASPAPPIIVEEDGASSNSVNPPNVAFTTYQSVPILAPKSYEQRNLALSDTTSTTSSTSSTNGDSSAASIAGDMILPSSRSNGLPVLEKMTTADLRLPRISSPINSALPPLIKAVEPTAPPESDQPTPPVTVPNEAVGVVNVVPPKKKPTRRSRPAKRRRAQKRRWSNGNDSDYEILGKRASFLKKAQEKVQKAVAQKRGSKAGEITVQQRYLKSPFFCLCQSVNEVAAGASKPVSDSLPPNGDQSLSLHSAHVINPAVPVDEPINCPILQANNAAKNRPIRILDKPTNELSAFFATSRYKPTLRPGSSYPDPRIPPSYTETACPSWRCVFCAEPPTFDRLSPLYGPYFVGPEVTAKFSPAPSLRLVIKAIAPPPDGTISTKNLPEVAPSPNKKRIINSSSKTKGKAGGSEDRSENPADSTSNRIGRDGEVWCHLECVLWAPGTYIRGDGIIGGLDDAVTMALETPCSHCKKNGAILSCTKRGCNLFYHYYCAKLAECHFNEEQYTVLCRKHYVYS
ncbi:hypothetical protein Aperf_G00000112042 [Anoplocephala perfoliata]